MSLLAELSAAVIVGSKLGVKCVSLLAYVTLTPSLTSSLSESPSLSVCHSTFPRTHQTTLTPSQLSSTFSSMQHLSWLNLPMVNTTTPVLPLLGKLPALEQLYLQVWVCVCVMCVCVLCSCV